MSTIHLESPPSTSGYSISTPNSKPGGLFLDKNTLPHYLVNTHYDSSLRRHSGGVFLLKDWIFRGGFLSVSLSVKGNNENDGIVIKENKIKKKVNLRLRGKPAAVNTTKHLWAGAVAAMVSRYV